MDYGDHEADVHKACYIFANPGAHTGAIQPSVKRRRITGPKQNIVTAPSGDSTFKFTPTLNGSENETCISKRYQLFQECWAKAEERIQNILRESNEQPLSQIVKFIKNRADKKIPGQILAGLIVTGPNISSQGFLFEQLASRFAEESIDPVVVLKSGETPNLKTALKKIIRETTSIDTVDDGDPSDMRQQRNAKLLNYDLRGLHEHVRLNRCRQVIVCLQDSEAFDSGAVATLIALLNSWSDRIPFVVFFGIATSVELFQERLSRTCIRQLHGVQFEFEQVESTIQKVFEQVVIKSDTALRLGPNLLSQILRRQRDHSESLQAFIASLKYAYMSHFYANPLSILLAISPSDNEIADTLQAEHLEVIRMLPSFRRYVESMIAKKSGKKALGMLNSDETLRAEIVSTLSHRKETFSQLMRSVYFLHCLDTSEDLAMLYVRVISASADFPDLIESKITAFSQMSLTDLKIVIDRLKSTVEIMSDATHWQDQATVFLDFLSETQDELQDLEVEAERVGQPLRSRRAIQNKGVRTTVIAQRVELSREIASLSEADETFTNLMDCLEHGIREHLKFKSLQNLFLNEVWLYDSKFPHADVFMPKPGIALERALSTPHHYLGCECCGQSTGSLASSQPSTAILYQLYLETGGLVNVFDLWSAFFAIVGGDDGDACDERKALALFYRALADLKQLGMIKSSRKKTDHLAKLSWKSI